MRLNHVKPTINGDQQLAGSGFFPFCGLVQTLRIYPRIAIPMGNAMMKTSHHFQTNPRGCTIKIIGFFNHLPSAGVGQTLFFVAQALENILKHEKILQVCMGIVWLGGICLALKETCPWL